MSEETAKRRNPATALHQFREGRDEMNLAEFPLAAVADRFLDGTKTVVFSDTVWDPRQRSHVPRKLIISGSDRYGLMTAKDDDVLMACCQLSTLDDFRSRELSFSRYQILSLLRWPDRTANYHRVAVSLRRLKGVTIYSDRAWWDKAEQSWINRDFGIIDNLYLYERDARDGASSTCRSWLVWNEVLFRSFASGYIKQLDWDLYCRLRTPISKRLYRFLDKRFYRQSECTFDLHDLAFRRIRLSERYDTAQVKRMLRKGIAELEAEWELSPLPDEKRFVRLARGKWQVVFKRKPRKREKPAPRPVTPQETELIKRGVRQLKARQLVQAEPEEKIQEMIELFDLYAARGQAKEPGFLVASIEHPGGYALPEELRTMQRRPATADAAAPCVGNHQGSEDNEMETEQESREKALVAKYMESLSDEDAVEIERAAVRCADKFSRDGYDRHRDDGGDRFETYRELIIRRYVIRLLSAR